MRDKVFSKKEFIASVTENVKTMYRKTLKEATQQEIYQAVSLAVKDVVMDEWMATQQVIEKDDPKILYYMSMEFLMGRALGNNLINLDSSLTDSHKFSNIFCKGTARRQDGQYLKIMKFAIHVSAMHLAILLFHLFHSPVPSAIRLRYNRSNVPLSDEAQLSKPSAQ